MQLGPINLSTQTHPTSASPSPHPSYQHGLPQLHHAGSVPDGMQPRSSSNRTPQSVLGGPGGSSDAPVPGVSATQLEDRLRGLNVAGLSVADYPKTPGHRIAEYENALTPATPRQALGFKIVRRAGSQTLGGAQLTDFPNGS